MKRRVAAFALLVILATVCGITGYKIWDNSKSVDAGKARPTPDIIAYVVADQPFADKIEAVGTAMANEVATLTATAADTVTAINFEEGQPVTAGTVLVQLNDSEEIAQFDEAEKAFNRYEELARTNATSIAQRDNASAALKVAQARVKDRQIIAPFDGIAGFRHVSLGELVSAGTVVTAIYDNDPIKLEFTIPETFLSIVKPGLKIQARTSAWPDEIFEGVITVINPGINPETRAISLKAEIENSDDRLKPGLLMSTNIVKNERTSLAIPEAALIQSAQNHSVYVLDAENKVEPRSVTIGTREAGYVEIIEGLSSGEKIIAEGILKVRPGMAVGIGKTITLDEMLAGSKAMANPRKQKALE